MLTEHQWAVYDFARTIPRGRVTTYGALCKALGKGSPRSGAFHQPRVCVPRVRLCMRAYRGRCCDLIHLLMGTSRLCAAAQPICAVRTLP